jgi:hypothetical protein
MNNIHVIRMHADEKYRNIVRVVKETQPKLKGRALEREIARLEKLIK